MNGVCSDTMSRAEACTAFLDDGCESTVELVKEINLRTGKRVVHMNKITGDVSRTDLVGFFRRSCTSPS